MNLNDPALRQRNPGPINSRRPPDKFDTVGNAKHAAHRLAAGGAMTDGSDDSLEIVRGSGNVFRDFGYPDADLRQAQALLAAQIIKVLDAEKLSTRQAEARTGIAHSEFVRIRNVNLARFTIDWAGDNPRPPPARRSSCRSTFAPARREDGSGVVIPDVTHGPTRWGGGRKSEASSADRATSFPRSRMNDNSSAEYASLFRPTLAGINR